MAVSLMNRDGNVPDLFRKGDRYEYLGCLGQGAHATVYRARDCCTNKEVAIKHIKKTAGKPQKAMSEYLVGKKLVHRNVVQTLDCLETSRSVYIVFNIATDGDLFDRLDPSGSGLSESQARKWMKELAASLEYVHSKGIVHRDVKPENILLDKGTAKLCDFGLAVKDQAISRGRAPGTGAYMAPEILTAESRTRDRIVSSALDVWSFGIVMYAVLFADLPWESASKGDADFAQFFRDGGVQHDVYPYSLLSTELCELMSGMLSIDPKARVSMSTVHRFFKERQPWFAGERKQQHKSICEEEEETIEYEVPNRDLASLESPTGSMDNLSLYDDTTSMLSASTILSGSDISLDRFL